MENEELTFVAMTLTPENVSVLVNARMISTVSALFDRAAGADDSTPPMRVIGASTVTIVGLPRPMACKGGPEQILAALAEAGIRVVDVRMGGD